MNKDISNLQSSSSTLKGTVIQSLFAGFAGLILAFFLLLSTSIYLFFNPIAVNIAAQISIASKYLCAAVAAFIACANRRNKGYLRGVLGALCFVVLGALLFTLFSYDGFCLETFLYDLLICSVIGILSGAVAVNFNSKRKK